MYDFKMAKAIGSVCTSYMKTVVRFFMTGKFSIPTAAILACLPVMSVSLLFPSISESVLIFESVWIA